MQHEIFKDLWNENTVYQVMTSVFFSECFVKTFMPVYDFSSQLFCLHNKCEQNQFDRNSKINIENKYIVSLYNINKHFHNLFNFWGNPVGLDNQLM